MTMMSTSTTMIMTTRVTAATTTTEGFKLITGPRPGSFFDYRVNDYVERLNSASDYPFIE
jgi:hypothetical protein